MGKLSYSCVESVLVVVFLLAVGFLAWVLRFVFQTASGVVKRKSQSQRGVGKREHSEVLCPCVFGHYTSLEFTMGCTVASVSCFLLSALCQLLNSIICLCSKRRTYERTPKVNMIMWSFSAFFLYFGYAFLFVVAFERLWMTFSGTTMQLPRWAPKAFYSVFLACFFLFALSIALRRLRTGFNTVARAAAALRTFVYFAAFSVVIVLFFKKTAELTHDLQGTNDVIEAAIRLTICMTLSLLSTTIMALMWIATELFIASWNVRKLLCFSVLALDLCFNGFCLMCAFARAKNYYQRAFGKLHALFVARISMQSTDERDIAQYVAEEMAATNDMSL